MGLGKGIDRVKNDLITLRLNKKIWQNSLRKDKFPEGCVTLKIDRVMKLQ